jgi:RNA polymerase sigma-70 factor (ECF subfamily)
MKQGIDFRPKSPGEIGVRPVSSSQVTGLLIRWSEGDASAREELIPLVYNELQRLARQFIVGQRPGHTLQSTALVHEAYLRLVDCDSVHWQNRAQFFALAAKLMRQVLVDHSRARNAAKRDGGIRLTLQDALSLSRKRGGDLIALEEALNELAELDARQSQIVELRFFGGLSIEETGQVLGISIATVKRHWSTARIWLHHKMSRSAHS